MIVQVPQSTLGCLCVAILAEAVAFGLTGVAIHHESKRFYWTNPLKYCDQLLFGDTIRNIAYEYRT